MRHNRAMRVVSIAEAAAELPALIAAVERGEDITIARDGKAVACLRGIAEPPEPPRRLGLLVGQGWIASDFNAPMADDELAMWNETPLTSPA